MKNKFLHIPSLTVATVVALASSLSAATLYEDLFEYTPVGSALEGKNGGTGFTGAWDGEPGQVGDPVSGFGSMPLYGNAFYMNRTASGSGIQYFPSWRGGLSSGVSSGELWTAFLFQFSGTGPENEVSMEMRYNGNMRIGVDEETGRVYVRGSSKTVADSGSSLKGGGVYMIVAKWSNFNDPGGVTSDAWILDASAYNTLVGAGVTESNLAANAIQSVSATQAEGNVSTSDEVRILGIARNDGTNVALTVDEFRAGTQIGDVIVVPELSNISWLLAIGAGLFVFVARKHKKASSR